MSGAEKYWSGSAGKAGRPDVIYNMQFRIAGTPDNFRVGLAASGYTPDQIEQVIVGSISRTNFQTTMKAAYDAEVARKKVKEAGLIIPMEEIISLVKTTIKGKKPATGKTVTGKTSTRGDTLMQRVQGAINDNKTIKDVSAKIVIDVTGYDPVKQTGARKFLRGKLPKNRLSKNLDALPLTAKDLVHYEIGLNTLRQQNFPVDVAAFLTAARQELQQQVGAPAAVQPPVAIQPLAVQPVAVPAVRTEQVILPVVQQAGQLGLPAIGGGGIVGLPQVAPIQ